MPVVAVRPPEYFPRLVYVALMQAASRFIVADTRQYVRQSYQNRARIRTPRGWQWITVPVQRGQHGLPHSGIRIRPVPGWQLRHWKAFTYNYGTAPFFDHYREAVRPIFWQSWRSLADLTFATVRLVHEMYGLGSTLVRASSLTNDSAEILRDLGPRWLLSTLEDARFAPCECLLHFDHLRYRQGHDGFEEGMTALDLLFGYGPEAPGMLRRMVTIEHFGTCERP